MSLPTSGRSRSYKIVNPELVQATIRPRTDESAGVAAELREISPATARLLVCGPPQLLCDCRISLTTHRFKHPLHLDAQIEWVRPNPAGDWLVGCRFERPIAAEVFAELVESGVLNRRSSVRERSKIEVFVQLAPSSPRLNAIVTDFSEGGLCLTAPGGPERTRHVCVFGTLAGREARVPLKIRWSLAAMPNIFIGCEFMRQSDYQIVRGMHLESDQRALRDRAQRAVEQAFGCAAQPANLIIE
ncbi:MAG TPA: PilZ domain-containing protein [Pirellulales bacterium]|jgi:hypothetical protein|nr:PilZ domain-containing protein [Pirellulales bacterium]